MNIAQIIYIYQKIVHCIYQYIIQHLTSKYRGVCKYPNYFFSDSHWSFSQFVQAILVLSLSKFFFSQFLMFCFFHQFLQVFFFSQFLQVFFSFSFSKFFLSLSFSKFNRFIQCSTQPPVRLYTWLYSSICILIHS